MKILLVADGRSPITRRWIEELKLSDHTVGLVSSFPCDPPPELDSFSVLPICFARFAGSQVGRGTQDSEAHQATDQSLIKVIFKRYRKLFQSLRYWIGPPTLWWYRPKLRQIIKQERPDLVHALRIPFEGMLSLACPKEIPLVVSIWGNDLTLHAPKNLWMKKLTEKVLNQAQGLITDVDRDIQLAIQWGYSSQKPVLVALTSGGINLAKMAKIREDVLDPVIAALPSDKVWIVNPRGIRPGYVRNDTFFSAIPLVLEKTTKPVVFLCPSMENQPQASNWVKQFKIHDSVYLLPFLSQKQLWQLFSRSKLMISVTEHDGTPNSLLESMSMGAFPIVGNIESLREWIQQGENGMLVDPSSPEELAESILKALDDDELLQRAGEANLIQVQNRASAEAVRRMLNEFYGKIRKLPMP